MMNYINLYKLVLYTHFIFIAFLYFGCLSNNRFILELHLVLLIITITLFYFCNGCILTKLEKYLSNSNYSVIDPVLVKLGIDLNNFNRKKITLSIFAISLSITIYKLYYKSII